MTGPAQQSDADGLPSEISELRARNPELPRERDTSIARRVGRVSRSPAAVVLIVLGCCV
jgi:hypothetical protein